MREVDTKFGTRIKRLSPTEAKNWQQWKLHMIREIAQIKRTPQPIERTLRKGMNDLKKMEAVTKQADKNLGLVPIRGDIYAAMLRKWLRYPDFQKVSYFPHYDIYRRIRNTISYTHAITRDDQAEWLDYARSANQPCPFYAIPKIHKNDPLGSRPISAQHSYMLAPLSKSLARVLLDHQQKLCGITQDTQSFIQRIEETKITQQCVLLTYDVEKCYPSIDLQDAISTLHTNMQVMRTHNNFWTKILQIIMFNNYVTANGETYRQLIGTATGTQTAPPFANLYLYYKYRHILRDPAIILHERYIDDGFLIVNSRSNAERIIRQLGNTSNLNLTYEVSDQKAIFLDLTIYKGPRFTRERILDLRPFFKPTNRLLFLPWNSNHPPSMKVGIIKGEAIRLLRSSSDRLAWLNALQYLFTGLKARGYPPTVIQKAWRTVKYDDRQYYVQCTTSKSTPTGTLVMTPYHPDTRQCWRNLIARHPFENIFPQRKLRWNKRQLRIMAKWPPTIIWCEFYKVGHNLISAKQEWMYPSKRRRLKELAQPQAKKPRKSTPRTGTNVSK